MTTAKARCEIQIELDDDEIMGERQQDDPGGKIAEQHGDREHRLAGQTAAAGGACRLCHCARRLHGRGRGGHAIRKDFVHGRHEARHVEVEIAPGIHLQRVEQAKLPQALGKLACLRHDRGLEKNGNDANGAGEGDLQFDPDGIGVLEDPRWAVFSLAAPMRAHGDQQDLDLAQDTLDVSLKVHSVGNGLDVHEDFLCPVALDQTIEDAPDDRLRARTTIGNRDFRHC